MRLARINETGAIDEIDVSLEGLAGTNHTLRVNIIKCEDPVTVANSTVVSLSAGDFTIIADKIFRNGSNAPESIAFNLPEGKKPEESEEAAFSLLAKNNFRKPRTLGVNHEDGRRTTAIFMVKKTAGQPVTLSVTLTGYDAAGKESSVDKKYAEIIENTLKNAGFTFDEKRKIYTPNAPFMKENEDAVLNTASDALSRNHGFQVGFAAKIEEAPAYRKLFGR